ncbi:ABC transporter ATP-binding protein [Marinomonas transparens]|uniref:ABC transporter ATP-binding protein n=1 Tax=Marinomonas transparens TaxID=2795388 RepID=A0A934JNA4_9GAMM|nr:ABC transporter ATP-binding protein [Marinomonas transparens]MBJ7538951.1 ABC transporter ATP-binding protein [Marinomonas transparens]
MLSTLRELPIFQKTEWLLCGALCVVEGLCICLPYALLLLVIEALIQPSVDLLLLGQLLLFMVLVLLIRICVTQQSMVRTTYMSYASCGKLRTRLAAHLFRVPMGFFYQHNTGDISQVMNKGVAFAETIFGHFLSQLIICLTIMVAMTLGFFWLDWRLALCLLTGLPIAFVLQVFLKQGADQMSVAMLDSMKQTHNDSMDWVCGIREQKLSGKGREQLNLLEKQIRETQALSLKHEARVGLIPLVFMVLPEAGFAVFLWASLNIYFDSTLSLTTFAVFLIASVRLYSSLGQLSIGMAESRFMKHALIKIKDLLTVATCPIGTTESPLFGTVSVNKLNFSYEKSTKQQLNNIHFTAKKGTLTAIVGPSGAGKTTLLHVLARLWPVQSGQIFLDHTSLEQFSDHGLYSQLALISQDVQLFDDTVMNNLLMMKDGLTEDAVFKACRQAQCDDFIRRLPQGYHTHLGESGNLLSGGERQRLSLARALLLDAKILLLDEISSALDVKNETHILALLQELKKDKTLIMIAHRESLVRDADQVVMLENGELCASGKHQELLISNQRYHRLWNP